MFQIRNVEPDVLTVETFAQRVNEIFRSIEEQIQRMQIEYDERTSDVEGSFSGIKELQERIEKISEVSSITVTGTYKYDSVDANTYYNCAVPMDRPSGMDLVGVVSFRIASPSGGLASQAQIMQVYPEGNDIVHVAFKNDGNAGTNWTITVVGLYCGLNASVWKRNTAYQEGFVASAEGQVNKVWKTDQFGNPAWRPDATGDGTDMEPMTNLEIEELLN